ncbi:MAG TPA: Sec-independent protein translocase protein TatB [Xanthobacteraceae bacterium]|nr:Sec-independent protein translocase protein TatB [Xanthobacteraceae bacterium]
MLDISWTEFLLIGIVALIVIGPKELPAVMRTMGQWTRKLRSMAADFQTQFQEAMREAEMADLKKEVDDIAHDIKHYDPLKDARADVESIGKDIDSSVAPQPASEPSEPEAAAAPGDAEIVAAAAAPVAPPSAETVAPASAETAAPPDSTGRAE